MASAEDRWSAKSLTAVRKRVHRLSGCLGLRIHLDGNDGHDRTHVDGSPVIHGAPKARAKSLIETHLLDSPDFYNLF